MYLFKGDSFMIDGWKDCCVTNPSGPQNHSGQQVFDCVPAEGVIPAGGNQEVTVTFAPDHPSDQYSDGIRIELFGQVKT